MRRDVRSPGLAGHRSLLPKRRDGSRFRLTMLVVCCMAAVGLTIPAVSVTGRLLASSGSTAGRPSSAGSILAAGASSARGAVTNPAVAASALAASTSTAPTDCADVLFVGARGSGEPGPGDRGWEPTKDDPYGLGATIESARQRLVADLGTNRTMQTESVSYVANGVQTILHAPNQYFANLNVGVTWTLGVLGGEARNCPAQQIVLAGFSQGAMVMHRVLHDLTNSKTASDRALLARVAAAILVGDGDQVPYDNEVLDGTAGAGAKGIGHLYPSISHTSNAKFPQSLGVKVQRVCYRHDPVCDVTEAELNPIAFHIHTSYPGGASLLGAADQAALDVRNMPAPRALTITAPVDTALSYQLSADIASGSTLQWRLAAGAKLAPGLTLSRTGLMTGTPTTVGTYSTPVQVRAVHAKTAGPWLPATLTVTVTSASSTSSGGSWAATEAPVPGDGSPSPSITSMSCASASSCAAIGDYKNSEGDASMLLTRFGRVLDDLTGSPPSRYQRQPSHRKERVLRVTVVLRRRWRVLHPRHRRPDTNLDWRVVAGNAAAPSGQCRRCGVCEPGRRIVPVGVLLRRCGQLYRHLGPRGGAATDLVGRVVVGRGGPASRQRCRPGYRH